MSATPIIVRGVVKDDGTLELAEKVNLPPGPVQVTVQPAPQPVPPEDTLGALMERIWAGQRARGFVPRTKEQIDADLDELRNEVEEKIEENIRLHMEAKRLREQKETPPETSA
jgi:hypothetical protein